MMNEDLWDDYEVQSKSYFKNRFRYIDIENITSQEDLDHAWNIFEHNITHSYELSLVGYLDDTTWFSPSLEKLELKLDIAHSFYDMAKIKVNIDKYKILTNQKLTDNIRNIQLTINGRQTEVEIVPKYKGTRILVKSQTNSLLALFNTDTLRPIAIQKLDILTQELWYLGIPQDINKYIGKISTPSYLSRSLALLEQYQIHLDLTVSYGIIGGHTPIVDYLPDLSHKKHNEWTYHWNASIQNCVIGKTYVQDTDTHSSISTMEHYIPINNSLLVNDSSSQPLRSSPLILIPCTGCHLNDNSLVLLDVRIKCSISIRTIRLSVFNIFHRSNQEHKKYANLLLKKYFVSTKPLHFIRHSAHSIYLAQHNINTITPTHTSLSANSPSSVNDDIINQLILPIQSALLCIDSIKLSLIDIAKKFLPFTNFEFYSDGSVSDIGTINSKSGFESRINNSHMFKLLPDILDSARQADPNTPIRIPREQPWILLLHHLIPRDLTVFFDNYFSKQSEQENYRKNKTPSRPQPPLPADETPLVVPFRRRHQYTRYYHNKVLPYFKQLVNIDSIKEDWEKTIVNLRFKMIINITNIYVASISVLAFGRGQANLFGRWPSAKGNGQN
ncbi:5164_t:CDS:2 [Rhizophagus irregularis]|nr:5164_t:CDS:2 [Rhizophagus irregularis]